MTNPQHAERIARLALASPLYARMLACDPSLGAWLEQTGAMPALPLIRIMQTLLPAQPSLSALRQFRRRISLLIAYRSVNDLDTERETTAALTRLAEFCLGKITAHALDLWHARRGEPWDDDLNRPAHFAILALGKMGGEELNFSSDIDLIYLYEGDGQCRLDGRITEFSSVEFFTKVAETITQELSAQTPDGFLFRVDARLRPEGDAGPLVRSVVSLENYYATAGQTWERLALLKARPVAGDIAVAAELLEALQAFRYPRHPPPSLLAEIAAMRQRGMVFEETTQRSSDQHAAFNVKLGVGGIREIEFIAQLLQLLHAGRYPFLQTHSTQTAFEQLAQYDLFPSGDVKFLIDAYWFLRRVEHRIQMREEAHTHTLPANPAELADIALSLGFADVPVFLKKLGAVRQRIHALYENLMAPASRDEEFENWRIFFTTGKISQAIERRFCMWFGREEKDFPEALCILVCGDSSHLVTHAQITQFRHLAKTFDTLMPVLARPAFTLRRLSRFAERYASRQQFLGTCTSNPQFLRALALLFDRSAHACALLVAHPEIFEEVLRTGELRQRKNRAALLGDIARGPGAGKNADAFAHWLSLYLRAEQLRYSIGELFGFLTTIEVEAALTLLADTVVESTLARIPGGDSLLVVALGKYGGAELTFGSDLDMMLVADDDAIGAPEKLSLLENVARQLVQILRGDSDDSTPAFATDMRLRPHGEAGPLITTVHALRTYHATGGDDNGAGGGPGAQTWEKQVLTRARCVCGLVKLRADFEDWRTILLYSTPIMPAQVAEIRAMRERITRERNVCEPPWRAFKTCAGGLVDFEFFAQTMQLLHGCEPEREALRQTSTRAVLAALRVPEEILENYDFLKRVEIAVRRDENKPVAILPAPGTIEMEALARWLGFRDSALFLGDYTHRLTRTCELLAGIA